MRSRTVIISPYSSGGSLLYLQHLIHAFEKKDYQVTFCLPKDAGIKIQTKMNCYYILRDPSAHPVFLKIKFFKYIYHLSKYLYNSLKVEPEEDFIVAHLLFPFYLTDLLTIRRLKKKRCKVILTIHEVFPHKPFLGGKIDLRIIKRLYENADLLLVHSNTLKNELLDLFSLNPEKVRVIPHGYFDLPQSPVDTITLKKKYHVPPDRKILLFFGTIRENKGLDILLDVMKAVKEDFFLLIAGQIAGVSEPSADHYKNIIRTCNIDDSVYWVERYITEEEAAEVFKIADTVVLPYRKSFHAQSGVLNLAIGYEKPCIVSDVGGIGETVRLYDLGIVVEPENTEDLQRGITRVFEGNIKFGFDKYKNNNNWDKVSDRLIGTYEELMNK